MVAEVLHNVPDCIADFAGSLQHVRMVSIQEYLSRTGSQPVQGLRKAYRQALDGAREDDWIIDFDDQVQMIPLDRVVHDPHSGAVLDLAQCLLDGSHSTEGTEKAYAGQEAERDVHGMPRSKRRTAQVRYAWLVTVRFAPCVLSLATPSR